MLGSLRAHAHICSQYERTSTHNSLHLSFIPIKVNTKLCFKAPQLGRRQRRTALMKGYYPGRMMRALSASPEPQSPLPSTRCPPQLPHPSPLPPNFPRQLTPRSFFFFFTSSFLHLAHFLPSIHPYFGRRALNQTDTCSLCLLPSVRPHLCRSCVALPLRSAASISAAHFHSLDPNLSCVLPGLNNPPQNSALF